MFWNHLLFTVMVIFMHYSRNFNTVYEVTLMKCFTQTENATTIGLHGWVLKKTLNIITDILSCKMSWRLLTKLLGIVAQTVSVSKTTG